MTWNARRMVGLVRRTAKGASVSGDGELPVTRLADAHAQADIGIVEGLLHALQLLVGIDAGEGLAVLRGLEPRDVKPGPVVDVPLLRIGQLQHLDDAREDGLTLGL